MQNLAVQFLLGLTDVEVHERCKISTEVGLKTGSNEINLDFLRSGVYLFKTEKKNAFKVIKK